MEETSPPMDPRTYGIFVDFLRKTLGHELGPEKEYLLENRLMPLCEESGMAGLAELAHKIQHDPYCFLGRQVIERMTIQETSFFRGPRVFANLKDLVIPRLVDQNRDARTLRIWSACCSTGQEPYSIMMMLWEGFPQLADWNIQVQATDVSETALEKAKSGSYSRFETIRGLPTAYREKYFQETPLGFTAIQKLRDSVTFSQQNLLDPFYFGPEKFDLILLRNVLIYFAQDTISKIFLKLRRVIKDNGFLVLGEAETVLGRTDQFSLPSDGVGYFLPRQSLVHRS